MSLIRCALCENVRPLRKSHVIPEFFYRPGYDEKGRLIQVERGSPRSRFIQKGKREPLLCADCEEFLNKTYERPIFRAWPTIIPAVISGREHFVAGVEYVTFRLFHLSILWRAAVAVDDFWGEVSLGSPHRERLRKMLVDADAGPAHLYPFIANVMLKPGTRRPAFGTIASPTRSRAHSARAYSFIYGGCIWKFFEASHAVFEPDYPYVLSPVGEMKLLVQDMREVTGVDQMMRGHMRLKRDRTAR